MNASIPNLLSIPSMHLIEIFLPLTDNEGAPFPQTLYADLRHRLTERFGGLTAFSRSPARGFFKDGGGVVQDDIIVFEVMAEHLDASWWQQLKTGLENDFHQDEILIRASQIQLL
jgi:hypothetical protein